MNDINLRATSGSDDSQVENRVGVVAVRRQPVSKPTMAAMVEPERHRGRWWAAAPWTTCVCLLALTCGCAVIAAVDGRQLPASDAERLRRIDEQVERCATGRGDAAVEACRAAVKLGLVETGRAWPDSALFYETIGDALVLERRYEEALAGYREGVRRYRANARLHYALGRLLVERYDAYEEALGPYSEAVRWSPEFKEALSGLGDVKASLHRYSESIVSYRAALGVDPRYVPALIGLGYALTDSGDSRAAIDPLSQAVRLSLADTAALIGLGSALSINGRVPEAIEMLRRALKSSEDPWTYCQLARALARGGQEKEAHEACERARRPHNGGNMSAPCDCR
jgi:tetratricopeptide (TPR) repeat protein